MDEKLGEVIYKLTVKRGLASPLERLTCEGGSPMSNFQVAGL